MTRTQRLHNIRDRLVSAAPLLLLGVLIGTIVGVLYAPPRSACADASCQVGDDEEFHSNIVWYSDTGYPVTFDHAATAAVTVTIPTAASSTLVSIDEAQTLTNKTLSTANTIGSGLTWSAAQNLASQALTNVNIDSGDISAATVSGSLTWSAAQNFNSQALTNVNVDSGSIDGATIGLATANTGRFTSLVADPQAQDPTPVDLIEAYANGVGNLGTLRLRGTSAAGDNQPFSRIDFASSLSGNTNEINAAIEGYRAGDSNEGILRMMLAPSGGGALVEGARFTDGSAWLGGYLDIPEIAAPGASAANTARIYAVVGGDTLTDLAAVFQDGSVAIFAEETTPLDSPILRYPDGTGLNIVLRKPHPGVVKVVALFPDGTEFTIAEHRYYNEAKVNANKGAAVTALPLDWYAGIDPATGRALPALDPALAPLSLGEQNQALTETGEVLLVHILELEERVKTLEALVP